MTNYIDIASNLYDGGWRAKDRHGLEACYDFEPDELDEICHWLAEFENFE